MYRQIPSMYHRENTRQERDRRTLPNNRKFKNKGSCQAINGNSSAGSKGTMATIVYSWLAVLSSCLQTKDGVKGGWPVEAVAGIGRALPRLRSMQASSKPDNNVN